MRRMVQNSFFSFFFFNEFFFKFWFHWGETNLKSSESHCFTEISQYRGGSNNVKAVCIFNGVNEEKSVFANLTVIQRTVSRLQGQGPLCCGSLRVFEFRTRRFTAVSLDEWELSIYEIFQTWNVKVRQEPLVMAVNHSI